MRALQHLGWALVCALAVVPTAMAQQSASISGVVTDATGGVIPGVTIEASSPVLIEKVRTAVSEGNGRYQFVDLRPGTYTVTFTLQGFSTVRREGITLTAGFAASVNVELKAGAISETITVSGSSPMVDIRNVAQAQVMTRDVLDTAPTARVIGSLMTLVPGVTITTAGGPNVDAGGTAGYTYAAAQIHGSSQYRPDHRYIRHPDGADRQHRQVAHQPSGRHGAGIRHALLVAAGRACLRRLHGQRDSEGGRQSLHQLGLLHGHWQRAPRRATSTTNCARRD